MAAREGEFAIADVPAADRVADHAIGGFVDPDFGRQTGELAARGVVRTLAAGLANHERPP